MVCMADTATVKKFMKKLRENGCVVTEDYTDTLTVEAKDGPVTVYRAIQKGKNQPWLVRCVDTERFTWK